MSKFKVSMTTSDEEEEALLDAVKSLAAELQEAIRRLTPFIGKNKSNRTAKATPEAPRDLVISLEWALIPLFCDATGYTKRAVESKIFHGVWIEGVHYKRAPDGRITMNLRAYYRWVEGKILPAN